MTPQAVHTLGVMLLVLILAYEGGRSHIREKRQAHHASKAVHKG